VSQLRYRTLSPPPGWPWIFSLQCATCSEAEEYVFAFYRCFLLMLGDRPDTFNNVERIFAVALLSLGACLYAVVVRTHPTAMYGFWWTWWHGA
jgi:hypothetical protein